MEEQNNKNLILAMVLSAIVMVVWFVLFPPPEPPATTVPATETAVAATGDAAATAAVEPNATQTEATPVPEAPRVKIDTAKLGGSLSLRGGRIDDLSLKTYREELAPDSPTVRLLSPVGEDLSYYSVFGWLPGTGLETGDVPDANTLWTTTGTGALTVETPVTLRWENSKGVSFLREISVDEDFMFTVKDTVQNASAAEVALQPYGIVARHGLPKLQNIFVVHEGAVQRIDGELTETDYADVAEFDVNEREGLPAEVTEATTDGWIGFTDHYWMTTLVPEQGKPFKSVLKYVPDAGIYQAEVRQPVVSLAQGATATSSIRFFAGAKEWAKIRAYENDDGIPGFIDSIDWGWFYFLTKPIFAVLHWLNALIGNMGIAIIALTFFLKFLVLPLAYKSYVSMARM